MCHETGEQHKILHFFQFHFFDAGFLILSQIDYDDFRIRAPLLAPILALSVTIITRNGFDKSTQSSFVGEGRYRKVIDLTGSQSS